jgi:hypothetical protein
MGAVAAGTNRGDAAAKESDRCESGGRFSSCGFGSCVRLVRAMHDWRARHAYRSAGASAFPRRAGSPGATSWPPPPATTFRTLQNLSEIERFAPACQKTQIGYCQALAETGAEWHRTCPYARHNMGAVAAGTNRGDATAKESDRCESSGRFSFVRRCGRYAVRPTADDARLTAHASQTRRGWTPRCDLRRRLPDCTCRNMYRNPARCIGKRGSRGGGPTTSTQALTSS